MRALAQECDYDLCVQRAFAPHFYSFMLNYEVEIRARTGEFSTLNLKGV